VVDGTGAELVVDSNGAVDVVAGSTDDADAVVAVLLSDIELDSELASLAHADSASRTKAAPVSASCLVEIIRGRYLSGPSESHRFPASSTD